MRDSPFEKSEEHIIGDGLRAALEREDWDEQMEAFSESVMEDTGIERPDWVFDQLSVGDIVQVTLFGDPARYDYPDHAAYELGERTMRLQLYHVPEAGSSGSVVRGVDYFGMPWFVNLLWGFGGRLNYFDQLRSGKASAPFKHEILAFEIVPDDEASPSPLQESAMDAATSDVANES